MRPRSDEQVIAASGHDRRDDLGRAPLVAGIERREDRRDADRPQARRLHLAAAALATAASSSGMNGRPSYSWPPSTIQTPPRTSAARSSGQSQNGGSERRGRHAEAQRRDLGEVRGAAPRR